MANEITYQFQVQLVNGNLRDAFNSNSKASDQASAFLIRNVQTVGFAAHEALQLGDLTDLGYAAFQNLDDTNYIEVGIDVGASFYPFVKLLAGELCLVKLGTNAPYAQANVAAVDLFYIIYSV